MNRRSFLSFLSVAPVAVPMATAAALRVEIDMVEGEIAAMPMIPDQGERAALEAQLHRRTFLYDELHEFSTTYVPYDRTLESRRFQIEEIARVFGAPFRQLEVKK